MLVNKLQNPRLTTLFRRAFSSNVQAAEKVEAAVIKREHLQFSKSRLTDFGELPRGEIPAALKYDRVFNSGTTANGVRVGTEQSSGPLASVSVLIRAGSRNETLETSGVSHILEGLLFSGTKSKTKAQLEAALAELGGQIEVERGRETTRLSLTLLSQDVAKGVELLGDIVSNPLISKNDVALQRDIAYRKCVGNAQDQMECTLENVHYTSYRDHMMGQPRLGIRENIANITAEQVAEYHRANFYGSNIVVAAAGNINHESLVGVVDKAFGGLPQNIPSGVTVNNAEKPHLTPSIMVIRDDEMTNLNVGTFFEAPSWTDKDYFAMKLFQALLGEYTQDKYTGHHLNTSSRQYSNMHAFLGQYPDITLQACLYFPYSDTGLIGNYFHGNETHTYQMWHSGQVFLSEYAKYMAEYELYRARNKMYNQLTQMESTNDIARKVANQLLFLGRRIPRSEIAQRLSHFDVGTLGRVSKEWFWDRDISSVAWGATHNLMANSAYNRPQKRSTLGWNGSHFMDVL